MRRHFRCAFHRILALGGGDRNGGHDLDRLRGWGRVRCRGSWRWLEGRRCDDRAYALQMLLKFSDIRISLPTLVVNPVDLTGDTALVLLELPRDADLILLEVVAPHVEALAFGPLRCNLLPNTLYLLHSSLCKVTLIGAHFR